MRPCGMPKLTPWTPTDAHAAPLVDLITRAEAKTLEALTTELRADSLASALAAWPRVRATLERWLAPAMVSAVVTSTGEQARAASERAWAGQVSSALGQQVALDTSVGRQRLQAWIADNTARIESLRNESIARIRDDIETAVLSEARPEELAAKWEREGLPTLHGTLRGRAIVIARDQLGTLASQIAEHQQRALGVTHYTWDPMLSIPRKHRPVHLNRAGARYSWDSPPPGGHPGSEIMCSCRAVADVSAAQLRRRVG